MNKRPFADATKKALNFLRSVQLPDGGFDSYSSPTPTPFKPEVTYKTTFAPALILAAAASIQNPGAVKLRQKLAGWLLKQKSPQWSFNYWAAGAPQRRALPYPDDLDDTFCALIALYRHDPSLIDGACLGAVVKLLIAAETQVGGPYRTWLVAKDAPKVWQDVDLAVNSNIACFLKMVAEPLPNLNALMERAVSSGALKSPYYPSAYPLVYYLARACDDSLAPKLAGYLANRQQEGWWGTPLRTALSVSALCQLGRIEKCDRAAQRLLESQQADGSWAAESFCFDPAIKRQKYYSGSAALTTAFALEALTRYAEVSSAAKPKLRPRQSAKTDKSLHARSAAIAKKEIAALGPSLKRQGLAVLESTEKGDKNHEIILLPHIFNKSLINPVPGPDSPALTHLGVANFYGWAAYTVYDNFLDGEGDPKLLSAANVAQRYSLKHFRDALPDAGFHALAEQTFDAIDGANSWETEHCRAEVTAKTIALGKLPNYANTLSLADRSLGHTLAPLGVLAAAGVPPDDPRAQAVRLAFRHYLAARQLNDDMHDLEQDLRAGIITYVVAATLKQLSIPPGKYSLARLIPKLQRQFWHITLPGICRVVKTHTALARQAAAASRLLTTPNIITELADKIEASADETLAEQSKANKFLAAYNKSD